MTTTGPSAAELKHSALGNEETEILLSLDSEPTCEGLDDDQKIKIAKQLVYEAAQGHDTAAAKSALVRSALAANPDGTWKCPTVRFGRTDLQMPIVTCGGMRMQQAWGGAVTSMDEVLPECQANFEAIVQRALALGINHFETAKGYGCSEIQVSTGLDTVQNALTHSSPNQIPRLWQSAASSIPLLLCETCA